MDLSRWPCALYLTIIVILAIKDSAKLLIGKQKVSVLYTVNNCDIILL